MALEEILARNNELLERLVAQNDQILGIAAKRAAAGSTTTAPADGDDTKAEKPKRTASTKKDDAKKDAVTKADLSAAMIAWANEFGKATEGGHPEAIARHQLLKTTLAKVGGDGFTLKTLADNDQEKIDKLFNWLETKAKTVDKGFGVGRLVADPEPVEEAAEEASEEDDPLGV